MGGHPRQSGVAVGSRGAPQEARRHAKDKGSPPEGGSRDVLLTWPVPVCIMQ